jgi:hypothetical protein
MAIMYQQNQQRGKQQHYQLDSTHHKWGPQVDETLWCRFWLRVSVCQAGGDGESGAGGSFSSLLFPRVL